MKSNRCLTMHREENYTESSCKVGVGIESAKSKTFNFAVDLEWYAPSPFCEALPSCLPSDWCDESKPGSVIANKQAGCCGHWRLDQHSHVRRFLRSGSGLGQGTADSATANCQLPTATANCMVALFFVFYLINFSAQGRPGCFPGHLQNLGSRSFDAA